MARLIQVLLCTDSVALEGTGQGSGTSPTIWLIYMVSLLNAFKDFSPGMTITSPFEDLFVFILAIFFVDDGMPRVNDALEEEGLPLSDLLQTAQQLSQSWETLLFASGGALELTMCFAYVMYWDLTGGMHRLLQQDA